MGRHPAPKPPRRLTRAERKNQTREQLLAAAARVFARSGYAGASVDNIAEEAGFTVGALYSNFSSKQELFMAAFERHCDQELAEIQAIMDRAGTTEELMEAIGRRSQDLTPEHRQWWLLSTELWLHAQRDPSAQARMAAVDRKVRLVVAHTLQREATTSGRSLAQPATEIATAVFALWQGLMQQRLTDPAGVSADTFARAAIWMLQGAAASPSETMASPRARPARKRGSTPTRTPRTARTNNPTPGGS